MGILDALSRILATSGVQVDVMGFIVVFGLAFTRIVTAVNLAPFFGGSVPARVKVGLAVLIVAILFPQVAPPPQARNVQIIAFIGLLAKEAMVGVTIGMVAQFIFYAIQMAGTIMDTQRGMNQLTFFAPQLPGHTSSLGQFKFQAAIALFFTMDGHLFFIDGIARSFAPIPVMAFPQFHAGLEGVINQIIRLSADALVIGVKLAAPVLVALFLIDAAFGALGKVAGQINVHNESQPVKSLVGLVVFLFAVAFLMEQLRGHFLVMLQNIREITLGIA
ncbi:MAG: flagellar biosynthetic protein FliR [Bryobacteraceae bacterium]